MKKIKKRFAYPQNKVILIFILSFALFLFTILCMNSLKNVDVNINLFFNSIRETNLIELMNVFSFFGSPYFIVGISVFVLGFFILKRKYKEFSFYFFSNLVGNGLSLLLKEIIKRERPVNIFESDYSFPSNHALSSIIIFWSLAYLLKEKNKPLSIALFLAPLFVSFSRLYLGVHWFSDIIAGISLGTMIFSIMVYLHFYRKN